MSKICHRENAKPRQHTRNERKKQGCHRHNSRRSRCFIKGKNTETQTSLRRRMKRDKNKSLTRTTQVNIEQKPEEPNICQSQEQTRTGNLQDGGRGNIGSVRTRQKQKGRRVSTGLQQSSILFERTMRGRLALRVIGNLTESYDVSFADAIGSS